MPKKATKATVKKTKRTRIAKTTQHVDHHSFIIIAGGGLLVLFFIFLTLGGFSTPRTTHGPQSVVAETERVQENTVVISSAKFSPEILNVKVGTTVTWVNEDVVAHSATADDGSFDTDLLEQGEKGSVTFSNKGTFTYHSTVNPTLTGVIVVEE